MRSMRPAALPACVVLVLASGLHRVSALDEKSQGLKAHVGAANAFALELYARLATREGNLFFSPLSIHMALAMTQAGARGATAQAMAQTLHQGAGTDAPGASAARLLAALRPRALPGEPPSFQLEVANALWSDAGYPLLASFTTTLERDFLAASREVDFASSPAQACAAINEWVQKATRDRIQSIVDPIALSAVTRLVLTNAVYFKSAWAEEFAPSSTTDAPFQVGRNREVTVPLMQLEKRFKYWETPLLQGVELPYQLHELSMILLVPREVDGLGAVEKALSLRSLDAWMRTAKQRRVRLGLPRFRTEAGLSLRETLSAMGMADAFSGAADFSGMTAAEKLFIDSVLHKAFIAVDEKGTEAAAVTAVAVALAVESEPEEPVTVRADRPFLHAIRHTRTGALLFLGRLVEPAGR